MINRILALWATPRSTSTPFEWMMRERGDFTCHHEPVNEACYNGADSVSDRDAAVMVKPGVSFAAFWPAFQEEAREARVFVKDFAYSVMHMVDEVFLEQFQHTFLIRYPAKVLPSLYRHRPDFTADEAGFASLRQLFDRIAERDGAAPPVIMSEDLLDRPDQTVAADCAAVGIPFLPKALTWDSGRCEEVSWYDGGNWHDSLRHGTGIKRQKRDYVPLGYDPHLMRAYEACLPDYEALLRHRLPISEASARRQTAS